MKIETLTKLSPVFKKNGTVTAGNSSGINDGAAALVVGSHTIGDRVGAPPLARVVSAAVAGVEPRVMGLGPVPASQKVLDRANLTMELRRISL